VLRPTTAAPGKSVPVQSNYPTALSSHIGPHKPRPQYARSF
jgi:hypothetical protein